MDKTKQISSLAAGGSAVLLAAAYLFQALGWAPCAMCLWQRWPHWFAVGFGIAGYASTGTVHRVFCGLGALSALTTVGLAAYHSGVERKWWAGPSSCSASGGLNGLSAADLVPGAPAEALVLCDSLTPFFLGLTMANWNFIWSLVLCVLWGMSLRRAG